ncbi:MAG: hypothetical protein ABIC91_02995 [Nanoarchaeota archaeon]|nr:hypothetical protein [Nanoarchaeota archaeon]MBU1030557.1 hypothetical protein [Nanoarchaeota archaeon]MBU1850387.1 hypothetical protein [Nanoarchaeota archaeon]
MVGSAFAQISYRKSFSETREFVGTPIVADYDKNPDLDFTLATYEDGKYFKIRVHEDSHWSNDDILWELRQIVNESEDKKEVRVLGYYDRRGGSSTTEYGVLNLTTFVNFNETTGHEDVYFTDPEHSNFYEDRMNINFIYYPGHHFHKFMYPYKVRPAWDFDMDGIPNAWDVDPYHYGPWTDINNNHIWDWYDPMFQNLYWQHWGLNNDIWIGWYYDYHPRNDYYNHYRQKKKDYENSTGRTQRIADRQPKNNNPEKNFKSHKRPDDLESKIQKEEQKRKEQINNLKVKKLKEHREKEETIPYKKPETKYKPNNDNYSKPSNNYQKPTPKEKTKTYYSKPKPKNTPTKKSETRPVISTNKTSERKRTSNNNTTKNRDTKSEQRK